MICTGQLHFLDQFPPKQEIYTSENRSLGFRDIGFAVKLDRQNRSKMLHALSETIGVGTARFNSSQRLPL